jgi:hypothetical protein
MLFSLISKNNAMTILSKREMKKPDHIIIDLTGPEGNAFCLLGIAQKLAKELDLDKDKILNEMESGDYENLLEVMEKYFGDYIIMYR